MVEGLGFVRPARRDGYGLMCRIFKIKYIQVISGCGLNFFCHEFYIEKINQGIALNNF